MATTDAKAGFRLPWSSDRTTTDETDNADPQNAEATTEANEAATADVAPSPEAASQPVAEPDQVAGVTEGTEVADVTGMTEQIEGTTAETGPDTVALSRAADPEPAVLRSPSGRKPSKFLADLTRAMQAAAEESRALALSQLQAEAKTHIEQIHARSATEAADLRREADDDVAAVREWSKAEIARIREETESRIGDRKSRLETEIENHAAVIEHEIEGVQATVAGFESDMATFFERLLAEDDPTQFATMAERLPEPPSFSTVLIGTEPEPETGTAATDTTGDSADDVVAEAETPEGIASSEHAVTEAAAVTDEPTVETTASDAGTDSGAEPDHQSANGYVSSELIGDSSLSELGSFEAGAGEDGEVDREAAFAAIQAAAEAAASAEVAADPAAPAEAVADVATEINGSDSDDGDTVPEADLEIDPRMAALGLSPDYDAAEAEALASVDASGDEEIPEIGDDALAARLAGLVPNREAKTADPAASSTQVIVVGLVSVASIASFKRHLGRLPGVQSVGVSSGPEGEFVFAVNHAADVVLREAIPSLPSFQARVTGTSDGVVNVTAHDPESDS
jgi:hypothetical protein